MTWQRDRGLNELLNRILTRVPGRLPLPWDYFRVARQPRPHTRGASLIQVIVRPGRATTIILSCRTTAGRGGRAACSSGLHFRQRFPSPMEYVRDEAG